jgi:hypothetical protein
MWFHTVVSTKRNGMNKAMQRAPWQLADLTQRFRLLMSSGVTSGFLQGVPAKPDTCTCKRSLQSLVSLPWAQECNEQGHLMDGSSLWLSLASIRCWAQVLRSGLVHDGARVVW